nr:MAG TPA: hypothetical protein [Caudoviricetes sp.]
MVVRCLLRLYLAFAYLNSSYLFVVGSPSAVAYVSEPFRSLKRKKIKKRKRTDLVS